MTDMAVVTPSYAPDFELCRDLNRSVLAHSPDKVHHHILVADRDLGLFRQLAGPRTHIRSTSDFLPRSFISLPGVNGWINLRRIFPPLRGWITQQIVKLAAANAVDADVVLYVDSDIEFLRPFGSETFVKDGVVRFYRKPEAIDEQLPRHVIWHQTARRLLGLPQTEPPFTDYISSPVAWDPSIVRALLARVEEVTGRRWADAIGSQLHFSEATLYGVFVDHLVGAPGNSYVSDEMRCLNYYGVVPFDERGINKFLAGFQPDDLAVMISAKSHTPLELRRAALSRLIREGLPGQ